MNAWKFKKLPCHSCAIRIAERYKSASSSDCLYVHMEASIKRERRSIKLAGGGVLPADGKEGKKKKKKKTG